MKPEDMRPGVCYRVDLKRVGGFAGNYEGRFVKHTFTSRHEEAILLGVVGEGRGVRIATSLITDVREAPDLEVASIEAAS